MEQERIPVYGKDFEDKDKRAFDWIVDNGRLFVETKDRYGHTVRTPANKALAPYMKLHKQIMGINP